MQARFTAFFLALFLVFINLQEIAVSKLQIEWLSYLDELVAIAVLILSLVFIKRREDVWLILVPFGVALSFFYSVLVGYFSLGQVRLVPSLVQSIINFKFFIYFSLFYVCYISFGRDYKSFVFPIVSVLVVSIFGLTLNILFRDFFIFSEMPWHLERHRVVGFQFKPNDLGLYLSFLVPVIFCLYLKSYVRFLAIMALLALVYLTGSRTALLIAMGAFIYSLFIRLPIYAVLIIIACLGFFLFVAVFGLPEFFILTESVKNINELLDIETTRYIRAVMIYYGFYLAYIFFPFGVGAGGFGSVTSLGSNAYNLIPNWDSNSLITIAGIYDSNLASLVAEYGLIVAISLYVFVWGLFYKVLKLSFEKSVLFVGMVFVISLSQPMISYQVNALNIILIAYSVKLLDLKGRELSV